MTGKRHAPAVLLLGLVLLAACSRAPKAGDGESASGAFAPGAIGRVDAVEGQAFVWHVGQRADATKGTSLVSGDRLETGTPGKIRAVLVDASVLSVGAGTDLALSDLSLESGSRSGHLKVVAGRFWMQITKWTGTGTSRYDIATPNAVAGVRGTTLWGDTDVDAICALDGNVEVRSLKAPRLAPATLSAGYCASALSQGQLAPMAPTAEQVKGYLDQVLIR